MPAWGTRGRWTTGLVRWPPFSLWASVSNIDEFANSISALYGDLDYHEGDFVWTVLFASTSASVTVDEDGGITRVNAWFAPSPYLTRAYFHLDAPDPESEAFGIQFEFAGDPLVLAVITVAIHRSGLDWWSMDSWNSGPASSFLVSDYDISEFILVFVRSDAGASVAGGTLIERAEEATGLGVVEAWYLPGSGTVDIDVSALSGNLQWATWVDVYEM